MIKIKMGMVGGGPGAFIGEVHRMAARLDGRIDLVCGSFSSNPVTSRSFGESLGLDSGRCYDTYGEMITEETKLPERDRMDFVAIATPNNIHLEPARLALENGFHVLSDKPATLNLAEAISLKEIVDKTGLIYGITHNYTGYPMVKEAREWVKSGKIGEVRKVVTEYPQGWMSTKLEDLGHKQATWRNDPSQAGEGGSLGNIGTHAENLTEYVTGLKIEELSADVSAIVEGRRLDDDANILVRLENGARGIIYCSQISLGEENPLSIRVYGTQASLEWRQMEPNNLVIKYLDKPMQILRTGHAYLSQSSLSVSRIPPGHPEGFIEAFANLYLEFGSAIENYRQSGEFQSGEYDFPDIHDAVRGMRFVEKAIESSKGTEKWTKF